MSIACMTSYVITIATRVCIISNRYSIMDEIVHGGVLDRSRSCLVSGGGCGLSFAVR